MVLMFASAVFYPAHKIPAAAWQFLKFNPVLLVIEMSRDVVLWNREINPKHLAYIYFVGIASAIIGHFVFRKLKSAFADVL
jgi:lipopolysaccharide transport system permease protein